MEICKPECVVNMPSTNWADACNIKTRSGGIARLTFLKCVPNLIFPSPSGWSNPDNITWAMCAGYLFVTGKILGQKPKGSFTKRRLTSCDPEETISGTKTITFQDSNADTDNLADFDFYDAVAKNQKYMGFGWITCDERWYQFQGSWNIEVDEVQEDTSEGTSFYDGTITMSSKELIKPIVVPGILQAIGSFNPANC